MIMQEAYMQLRRDNERFTESFTGNEIRLTDAVINGYCQIIKSRIVEFISDYKDNPNMQRFVDLLHAHTESLFDKVRGKFEAQGGRWILEEVEA